MHDGRKMSCGSAAPLIC